MDINEYIFNRLISDAHEVKESDPDPNRGLYRANALLTAADRIRKYNVPITSGIQARKAGLRVGDKIARRIDGYLKDYRSKQKPKDLPPSKKKVKQPAPKGPVIIPPSIHVRNLYISQRLKEVAESYKNSNPNKSTSLIMASDYIGHSQQHAADMDQIRLMSMENRYVKASESDIDQIMRNAYPIEYRQENLRVFYIYKNYFTKIISAMLKTSPEFKEVYFNVAIAPENISGEGQDSPTYAHFNIIFSSDKVKEKDIIDFLTPSLIAEDMGNNKYRLSIPESFKQQYTTLKEYPDQYAIIKILSKKGDPVYDMCAFMEYMKSERHKKGADMYFYVDENKCVLKSEIKDWWNVYFKENLRYCCKDKVVAYRLSVILRMLYMQRCSKTQ